MFLFYPDILQKHILGVRNTAIRQNRGIFAQGYLTVKIS